MVTPSLNRFLRSFFLRVFSPLSNLVLQVVLLSFTIPPPKIASFSPVLQRKVGPDFLLPLPDKIRPPFLAPAWFPLCDDHWTLLHPPRPLTESRSPFFLTEGHCQILSTVLVQLVPPPKMDGPRFFLFPIYSTPFSRVTLTPPHPLSVPSFCPLGYRLPSSTIWICERRFSGWITFVVGLNESMLEPIFCHSSKGRSKVFDLRRIVVVRSTLFA